MSTFNRSLWSGSLARLGFTGAAVLFSALSLLAGCSSSDSDSSSSSSCSSICKNVAAAHCSGETGNCEADCEQTSSSVPAACKSQLDALRSCYGGATYTCDADGTAVATACDAKLNAVVACTQNPGGGGGGNTELCAASTDDDACDTCGKKNCCSETTACVGNAQCIAVAVCATSCTSQSCIDDCYKADATGAALFKAVFDCSESKCSTVCS